MADAPAAETTDSVPNAPVAEVPAFVDLYAGTELGAADAEAVTLRSPAHLVVLAGAAESGKTTVLGSIYERLNQGPFAGFQFAGSRSLLGFEQICHLNRLASGGTRPDTPRTVPSDEAVYYHLALRGTEPGARRRHLLLSAISGELFRLAKNSREDCERLTFLHRANTIVVLVDGARLAVPAQRTNAQSEASSILDSFLDAKMVGSQCRVEFVVSKLDLVVDAGQPAVDFLNRAEEKFEARFRGRVGNLGFRRIAARPEVAPGYGTLADGLADAFVSWTTTTSGNQVDVWPLDAPPSNLREFGKYGWRHFAQSRRETP
ncbi:TRAFAC clade GTPase domain-containing protein [Corallococcus exiguus]|uniref:TRAFAC clade GTPase domain-containing protein n=1 Tax=Corallococcus exiguus TaxID=83462 RepID=UPI003DA658D3